MSEEPAKYLRAEAQGHPGRRCIRCGDPLSGRQKLFCSFGTPDSCHRLYYSELRTLGSLQVRQHDDAARDRLLFGRHMTPAQRLGALVQAARQVLGS